MRAATYEQQLEWLEKQVIRVRRKLGHAYWTATQKEALERDLHMLLSLAESVKDARRHNLDCRKDPHES